MKTLLAILVIAFSAVGCATGGHHSSSPWTVSPQGYHVAWNEQGSITEGRFTLAQVHEWHSKIVERSANDLFKNHAIPVAETMAKARSLAYDLIDNHSFEFGGIFACGQYLSTLNTIKVCLYGQNTVYALDAVPKDAPKWTVRPGYKIPGTFVYAVLMPGNEFPALVHELGHALRGPAFEH